ncbi:MAG: helix-turn-helix domain-containing protein [Acetobacteraceae bacterium]
MTDNDIEAAKAMLANPDIGVVQIAHRLGISPATLYRYLPAARTANTPGVCERPLYPKDRALHEGFSLAAAVRRKQSFARPRAVAWIVSMPGARIAISRLARRNHEARRQKGSHYRRQQRHRPGHSPPFHL